MIFQCTWVHLEMIRTEQVWIKLHVLDINGGTSQRFKSNDFRCAGSGGCSVKLVATVNWGHGILSTEGQYLYFNFALHHEDILNLNWCNSLMRYSTKKTNISDYLSNACLIFPFLKMKFHINCNYPMMHRGFNGWNNCGFCIKVDE